MMILGGIFGKEEEEGEDEFLEIEHEGESRRKVNVLVEALENYSDTERVLKLVRQGNIVFLKIKKLKETDLGELKRGVSKLKKTSVAMSGDIVGVDDNFLILTPPFAKIYRGPEEEVQVG